MPNIDNDEYEFGRAYSSKKPVMGWNPDSTACRSPHLLITGGTGAGKSTFLKDIINYLGNVRKKIVFVLDIHNGLLVDGENHVVYDARNTAVGINPFEFDNDIRNGGPDINVDSIVQSFKKHFMPNIGAVQINVLVDLMKDTYRYKGIIDADVDSWPLREIDDRYREDSSGNSLPTMSDLEDVYMMVIGRVENTGTSDFATVSQEMMNLRAKIDSAKDEKSEKRFQGQLDEKKVIYTKLEEAFHEYIEKGTVGDNITQVDKYGINYQKYADKKTITTLKTLGVYIRKFASMNLFNAKKPTFNSYINRLDISGFASADKPEYALFFFDLFLQRVFRKCKLKGEYQDRTEDKRKRGKKCDVYIVIDESRVVLPTGKDKDNPYHILNKIVSESRKFGLGIILGTQRVNHYNDEILTNMYTKIMLQTDPSDISATNKKLNITDTNLLALTKHNDIVVIGMGGQYKAVHLELFQQFVPVAINRIPDIRTI